MSSLLSQLYPDGIDSTLQRQLNRLPQEMYPLLTAAAVAGAEIDPALITKLIEQNQFNFLLEAWLVQSVSAALLEIQNEQIRFVNESVRLMLQDALDPHTKKEWHAHIATALEAVYGDDPSQAAGLAHHWQQVGDAAKEQTYARLAGEFASQQYEYDTAVRHFSRALQITAETDLAAQYSVLLAREKVFHIQGNRDAQKDDLIRLAEIADLLSQGDQEWRTEVALRLGAFAEATGEYTVAIVAATEALKMAQATQAIAHEAAGNLLWGQALLRRGQYAEAQEKLTLSQAQATEHQLAHIEADSLRFQGVSATEQGQFEPAKNAYAAALAIYQKLQDKRSESTVLNNLSIVAYAQNQLEKAVTHWEQARHVYETIGDKEGMARVLSNLSAVCLDLGDYEKGRQFSQEALTICRETDLRFGQGMNLINLSLFSINLGAEQQAEIYSLAALELAQELKSLPLEGLALKDRAYLLLRRQEWVGAADTYRQALGIWQKLSQSLQILEMHAGLGKVALMQNEMVQMEANMHPLLSHWQAENSFAGTSRPFFVYLALVEMLTVTGHELRSEVLSQAQAQLTLYASNIDDHMLKQAFFQDVPEHRQLMALVP